MGKHWVLVLCAGNADEVTARSHSLCVHRGSGV